jgi:hypothetical protein
MSYLSSKRHSTDLHEYPPDQDVAPDSKTATEKEDILDTSETTTQLDKTPFHLPQQAEKSLQN